MLLYLATKLAWKWFFLAGWGGGFVPSKNIYSKEGGNCRQWVLQGWGVSKGRGGASARAWALMIGGSGHCSFAILGLKLLYQNSLHCIGRVYLLLDYDVLQLRVEPWSLCLQPRRKVGIYFLLFTSVSPANASPWQPCCHSPSDGGTKR